jgi:hypothetical protein
LVVPGDYDGDGKTDFAIVREGTGSSPYLEWWWVDSSTGTVHGVAWGNTDDDIPVQNDYDGDGKTDVAIWRNSTGTFYVLNSAGGVNAVRWGTNGDYSVATYDTH